MRTRKHQSPVYSDGIASAICEEQGVFKVTSPVGRREREAANGVNQYDSGENYSNVDQKKINGKRQKRRKRSPRNKGLVPTVDCTLAGLMADHVWLEKTMYEEAESAYYSKLAEDQRKAVEAKSLAAVPVCNTHTVSEEAVRNIKPAIVNCCHGSMTACHHVDNGIWVNKFSFDEAESQFVMKFVSPLATHALGLPLVPHGGVSHHCTQRTPDEGYVSATSTPAAQRLLDVGAESSLVSADPTVNGKPHWSGLQDLVSEVWIDKHSYDHAERCFYETVAVRQSELKTEPHQPWSLHSGKKGKRDKWNRKSTGKQLASKKRDLPSIPEENGGLLHRPVYYFLHQDSENVWLDKSIYDKAEARYYASQEQIINQMVNMKKSPIAKLPKPAKPKHRAAPCHKK